ncbi:abortive infection family protein [Paenibacillus sp. MABNR03]|uniref:abortive infection family protein n=1 Tax=Paenibacillus sp. MABNR03 TaxID=3142626 RepID=UPI003D2C667B
MGDFIISSRTIDVFFNILSSKSTVNEISELFESEGIYEKPNFSSKHSGARKSTADAYVSNLDLGNKTDVQKLIRVIETYLIKNDNEYFNISEDIRFTQLIRLLNNDGFDYSNGKILPVNGVFVSQPESMFDTYSLEHVKKDWDRAIKESNTDPEDAITAARSMLESTCKWLMNRMEISYTERDDLPQLYKKVADKLEYFPDIDGERIVKQFTGSMSGIVSAVAEFRNKYGDSHGKNEHYIPPTSSHSVLTVNLSGALCTFLFETYMTNKYIKEGNNIS